MNVENKNMRSETLGACIGLLMLGTTLPVLASAAVSEDNFQLRSAGDLVTLCSAEPADRMMTAAANFCQGFVVGVYHILDEQQPGLRSKLFCMTDPRPTRSTAIAAFVEWIKPKQNVQALAPADAILAYLVDAYPCRKPR
jgi:hypothetical protein